MDARLCGRYGDSHRGRDLGHRQAFHVAEDDDGTVMRRKFSDRRVQRGPKLGPHRRVFDARRPVRDRIGLLPILMEQGNDLVQRDLGGSVRVVPQLVVGGVGDDPVNPRAEGRITPESLDLSDHAQQRVLHDLLGVRRVACDTNGQAVDAVSVGADEGLRRPRVRSAQLRHECGVRIDGLSREAWSLLVHTGLGIDPFDHDRRAIHLSLRLRRTGRLAAPPFGRRLA